jgi:hypothetical protein
VRGDGADYDGARADFDVVADFDVAEDFRAGADDYAVAERWVPLAGVLACAAEGDALVEEAVVADFGGLADDDAHAVVDEEAAADARRGGFDAGQVRESWLMMRAVYQLRRRSGARRDAAGSRGSPGNTARSRRRCARPGPGGRRFLFVRESLTSQIHYALKMTERLYYADCYLRNFDARVVETADEGRRVYLDRTAFYPTSGGQLFDIGTLGGVRHRSNR